MKQLISVRCCRDTFIPGFCLAVLSLCTSPLSAQDAPVQGKLVVVAENAIQPQMAIHEDTIYVTSIHQGNIVVSRSTDGGQSFGTPVIAIDVGGRARGGRHRGPRIGVDRHGVVTVTAPVTFDDREYQKRYPTADLYFTRSLDGGATWSAPQRLNSVAKKAPEALHWMAVEPDGDVHVAWLDMRGRETPGQDIYYVRLRDGRKTSPERVVARTVCECCAPGLSVDDRGNVLLAYREGGEKASREIFARRSSAGQDDFHDPVRINVKPTRESGCPMSAPAVAIQGERTAVAWKDMRHDEPNVYLTVTGGSEKRAEEAVHSTRQGDQNHPAMTFGTGGELWIVWEDSRNGGSDVYLRSSKPDSEMCLSGDIDAPCSYPVVAAKPGLIAVVWEAGKGNAKNVLFRGITARVRDPRAGLN